MRGLIIVALLLASLQASADTVTMSGVVRCPSPSHCELGWIRAAQWVTRNSPYKIRIANDYLIETFSSTYALDPQLSFRVQRIDFQGSPGIELVTRCYEEWLFPCKVDTQSYIDDFLKFLTAESVPPPDPTNGKPVLGVNLAPVSEAIAKALHQDFPHGAVVALVIPGSRAERAGIQIGDVILSHGESEIRVPADLTVAVRASPLGATNMIRLLRAGHPLSVTVTY